MGLGHPHERALATVMAREVLHIRAIAVAPPVQRCGIGSSLIREIADGGRACNASLLSVRFSRSRTDVGEFLRLAGFTLAEGPMRLFFADAPSHPVELGDTDIGRVWGFHVLQPRRVALDIKPVIDATRGESGPNRAE
ncbi:hypothetical protein LK09_15060 [Microbacterium mangrovi]|uniref:N-acetyltransferase domain-containing protein n=1 Tax=Microbacterium mangrovi TaxID=1348253 RepID=A0A0B2A4C7_9MICO|nr:hypothetical protein LK09_15060 [Microbacterium mangrovi]